MRIDACWLPAHAFANACPPQPRHGPRHPQGSAILAHPQGSAILARPDSPRVRAASRAASRVRATAAASSWQPPYCSSQRVSWEGVGAVDCCSRAEMAGGWGHSYYSRRAWDWGDAVTHCSQHRADCCSYPWGGGATRSGGDGLGDGGGGGGGGEDTITTPMLCQGGRGGTHARLGCV